MAIFASFARYIFQTFTFMATIIILYYVASAVFRAPAAPAVAGARRPERGPRQGSVKNLTIIKICNSQIHNQSFCYNVRAKGSAPVLFS